jgi:RNA polymerase sigma-70 factor, ECF subfamily
MALPGRACNPGRMPDLYGVMSERGASFGSPEQRFTKVFTDCYEPVLAFALRRVEPDLAQDIVAETFLAAWRHLADLRGEPLPWLYRVASHAIANQRRSATRRRRLDDRARLLTKEAASADHADGVTEASRLAVAFGSLSERDQEVLRLAMWERLDRSAAASVLRCSPATFKVRLHRARRRLSRLLDEEGGQPSPGPFQVAIPWKEIL